MHSPSFSEEPVAANYIKTKIGTLPLSWKVMSLEDVTDPSAPIRYGVVQIGPDTPDGVPIVPIKHIKKIKDVTLHCASPDIEVAYAGSRVKGGDVLLSVKGTIGEIGVVPSGFEGNIAREIARIRPITSCDADFLAFQLEADHTQRRIDSQTVGSTRLEFSIHAVRDFLIALPPLPEQRKIAAILRTWDDAIEKISSLISKQKQEKHIFQTQIFSGMLIPKSHKKKNISLYDLADWHNGLAFKNIYFSETGRPVLKIAELKSGVTSTTAFTNGKYAENVLVKSGDLLFSWSGNPDTSIDAFIWDGPEGWLNQHIFRVVPKPDVQKEYLYQFLRHIKNRLAYIATGKQSTGLGHVTKADMKRTYLVLPDMDDQIKISGLLNNFDVLISGLERQKKIFQSQKRGLMQKLLTGQWRVNVSDDAEAA